MYDVHKACEECCVHDYGPTLTQQSQADDADINTIVKRFGLTGQLPTNLRTPQYGDFTGINDYASALKAVAQAADEFMRIPAHIRIKFDNDPQTFLEFCANPENLPALKEMGFTSESYNQRTAPVPPANTGSSPQPESLPGGGNQPQPATGRPAAS